MIKTINAGVIGCNMTEEFFTTTFSNRVESFNWRKIYVTDTTGFRGYLNAEIVNKVDAIINDSDIELVFVSKKHLEHVKPVIDAGKSVRVI